VAGIAVDMALAASDSDFTAVSIALVALLMARSAVVSVLAESVAWAAAVFSLAAAAVTLVAAAETALGVAAGAAPDVAEVPRAAGLAAGARVPDVRGPVGTDLPPSRSVTGVIPHDVMLYTWQPEHA
jgi:hypothetical protein